jgi:putative mycofactocin binding protein MftB
VSPVGPGTATFGPMNGPTAEPVEFLPGRVLPDDCRDAYEKATGASPRLSFLKHPQLVRVVEQLAELPCAADALRAAGVPADREVAMTRALGTLAETGMIVPRDDRRAG